MAWHAGMGFPTSALGHVLGNAVDEHHRNSGLALELIAPFALGAVAVAVQDLVDVQRPNSPPSPTSLYICVIASTGEGKDYGAMPFLNPMLDIQAEFDAADKAGDTSHEIELLAWEIQDKELVDQFKCAMLARECPDSIKADLAAHRALRPKAPQTPTIVFKDMTEGAIQESMSEQWRSCVLFELEAGELFNGKLGYNYGFWNDRWGGSDIFHNRMTHARRTVRGARLGKILGVQRLAFERFLRNRGPEAHDSGFTARYLIACPPTTKGSRFITEALKSTDAIQAYVARCKDLLQQGIQAGRSGQLDRRVLAFTPEAQRYFVGIYNKLQALMAPGQPYSEISGQAAKAAENTARVAAVLHVFDDLPGMISEETLTRAATVVEWHTNQFLDLMNGTNPQAGLEHNAAVLEQILVQTRRQGYALLPRSDLKFWCPQALQGRKLDAALQMLISTGRARFVRIKRTLFVEVYVPAWLV